MNRWEFASGWVNELCSLCSQQPVVLCRGCRAYINSGFWIGDFGSRIPEFSGLPAVESIALFSRIDITQLDDFSTRNCLESRKFIASVPVLTPDIGDREIFGGAGSEYLPKSPQHRGWSYRSYIRIEAMRWGRSDRPPHRWDASPLPSVFYLLCFLRLLSSRPAISLPTRSNRRAFRGFAPLPACPMCKIRRRRGDRRTAVRYGGDV